MSADVDMNGLNGALNGHANGDAQMNGTTTPDAQQRFATGLILPPPDIKCEHICCCLAG
jgi:hypothetical protein